jgi:hypothetical protein
MDSISTIEMTTTGKISKGVISTMQVDSSSGAKVVSLSSIRMIKYTMRMNMIRLKVNQFIDRSKSNLNLSKKRTIKSNRSMILIRRRSPNRSNRISQSSRS